MVGTLHDLIVFLPEIEIVCQETAFINHVQIILLVTFLMMT